MICRFCGGTVRWAGSALNMAHTKCDVCHAINSQDVDLRDDSESDFTDPLLQEEHL